MKTNDVKDWLIQAFLYVIFFAAMCALVINLIERQKLLERIHQHEAELKELYNQN